MLPFLVRNKKLISYSMRDEPSEVTSGSVSLPAGVTSGNLLVLVVYAVQLSDPSLTYSPSSSFGGTTHIPSQTQVGGDGTNFYSCVFIATKIASGSEPSFYYLSFEDQASAYRAVVLNLTPVTNPTLSQLQNPLIDTTAPTANTTTDSPLTTLTQLPGGGPLSSSGSGYELLVLAASAQENAAPGNRNASILSGVSGMLPVYVGSLFNSNFLAMQLWIKPSQTETLNNVVLTTFDVIPTGMSINACLWYLGG